MQTAVTLSRVGLSFSILMAVVGIYNSITWSERAYDVKLQRSDQMSEIEVHALDNEAELYFARSKHGSSQMYSHGFAAMLFLYIAIRLRRVEADGSKVLSPPSVVETKSNPRILTEAPDMDQAAETNYDGFLAKAHLVQAAIGAVFSVWAYAQMGDFPALLILAPFAMFCVALAGVLFIRTRSVLAYPLFVLFNAAQLGNL